MITKAERAMDAIYASERIMLSPADVAPVLGCSPYSINIQARQDPARLGFPVCVMGTRVRIPKVPFIRWIEGQDLEAAP